MIRGRATCSVNPPCSGRLIWDEDLEAKEVELVCMQCSRPSWRIELAPVTLTA